MSVRPGVGREGGQEYPVLRSIQTFLNQMAEGGARAAPTVLKELLQNADDAGATEMHVLVDERCPSRDLPQEYARLFGPALLVRNNAPFRLKGECPGDLDDFTAIRDVASGHKRAQATAAGRFGIGFNSVYFLTDTPLLFSRREVHVFDLLKSVFPANGWAFSLDEFPASAASDAGRLKNVLAWSFPKAALHDAAFAEIAMDSRTHYRQAVFRLPFRTSAPDAEAIFADRFKTEEERASVLQDLVEEGKRSVLFLRHITRLTFGVLRGSGVEPVAVVESSPAPPEFAAFLNEVRALDEQPAANRRLDCAFNRTVTLTTFQEGQPEAPQAWPFRLLHVVRYDDGPLGEFRARLKRNGERAVPWGTLALPLDSAACTLDGDGPAKWRVVLPLLEEGPSACLFSGSLFVGPSRGRVEYRLNESDEGSRRTQWNQAIAERILMPALRDVSLDLPELAPALLNDNPRAYLALFPKADTGEAHLPASLAQHVSRMFGSERWLLRVADVWGDRFDVSVGDERGSLDLESVPEWLLAYRERFRHLSTRDRRFIQRRLGDALAERLGKSPGVTLRRSSAPDALLAVLLHETPPSVGDITKLLRPIVREADWACSLEGAWTFATPDGQTPLRYRAAKVYVIEDRGHEAAALTAFRSLGLSIEGVEWIGAKVGLPELLSEIRPGVRNVFTPTDEAAMELLRRFPAENSHDRVTSVHALVPFVDFLVEKADLRIPSDARLGFFIATARGKSSRRRLGVILLRPRSPNRLDDDIWELWFRRHFAEVDPTFAHQVSRLRQVRPEVLSLFQASDCRVFDGTADEALGILHVARTNAPDVYEELRTEINTARRGDAAQRISTWLLGRAADHWERLTQAERYTVLALPIHRRPDGVYVPLLAAQDGDPATVPALFRVQSERDLEDTHDAPVDVGAHQLLQSPSAPVQRFYRVILGLEAHGRVAVLKDVLRQIGNPGADNARLLRYLRSYYAETLRLLESRGAEADEFDAKELRTLFTEARSVPCLDGAWRRATDCVAAWRVAETLERQRWALAKIPKLIELLFVDSSVADVAQESADDVRALHKLPEIEPATLAHQALSSGAPELSLAWRAKVVWDNRQERSDSLPHRAPVLDGAHIAALSGTVLLHQAELLPDTSGLPTTVVAALAPTAVDVHKAADELSIGRESVTMVLDVLGVPRRTPHDLVERLVSRFAETWHAAASGDRLAILTWIDAHGLAAQLRPVAAGLDTVLDSSPSPQWRPAAEMLTPAVARERPPLLPPSRLPNPDASKAAEGRVWDEWCGVRTFEAALDIVLQVADGRKVRPSDVARDLYAWIGRVGASHGLDEVTIHLRSRRWVLARRGGEVEFRAPVDVLDHPAAAVLRSRFWVLESSLPEWTRRVSDRLGIRQAPEATTNVVRELAECLADPGARDDDAAVRAYALTADLVEQSATLQQEWSVVSSRTAVFRAFRREERRLRSQELFLGDDEYGEDISSRLLCLKAGTSQPRGVIGSYRRLGVSARPTLHHLLHAVSNLTATEQGARAAHGRLVRALESVPPMSGAEVEIAARAAQLRVLTCAGTYEPVSVCLWDPELGRKGRVEAATGGRLVDTADRASARLVSWLGERGVDVRRPLRAVCKVEVAESTAASGSEGGFDLLLWPWREWAKELAREGSTPREVLARHELPLPESAIRFVPVRTLRVRCRLDDDQAIEQSRDWEGPLAAATSNNGVLVRVTATLTAARSDSTVVALDAAIAREVALLLGGRATVARLDSTAAEIVKTIERPSTVLARLHATNLEHALHQYHDQVADPEFSELFDTYARTVPNSPQAAQLRSRMETLLRQRFVGGRRELIRGYGYDERSVFAELVQNAEDAYAQCSVLGLATPDPCDVSFRYANRVDGTRVLEFEHRGRIFNDWQRGPRREPSFARDVEGVLRSAGSFKPHQTGGAGDRQPDTAIGRFGLGFKSVYLLTDRPEVHSGPWNFVVEAACLPVEIPRPEDLSPESTRIRLPLRPDAATVQDVTHLIDLVPFLRRISRLSLESAGDGIARVDVTTTSLASGEDVDVQRVTLRGAVRGGEVILVRCRSRRHEGQLAIVVGGDGLPRRWDEAFEWDLFATLPLRARLGCGVGASHRFEVQSGRTHLVDPKANQHLCREVASLLAGIVAGVSAANDAEGTDDVLAHFWSLWRWDRGDSESGGLRTELAKSLADLAQTHRVVPTLDPGRPTSLGNGVVFAFAEVPDALRDAIVDEGLSLGANPPVKVTAGNVVADGFAAAFRRACAHAGVSVPNSLLSVGWAEIAAACRTNHWLADHPRLVSVLGKALSEEQRRRAAAWIALCNVRADADGGRRVLALPGDLLVPEFPGRRLLPARLLKVLHGGYDDAAVGLLTAAGLRPCPQSEDISSWVRTSNLTRDECLGLLRYLGDDGRFHRHAELAPLFRSQWFAGGSKRLTTREAVAAGLIPDDVISSDVFGTWLGLGGTAGPQVHPPVAPPIDPGRVLSRLHDWWNENGRREVRKYEARVYPGGRPPLLAGEFDTRNRAQRRSWLSLFLLGALHTMGRARPEQHRQFLGLCESKGWLDVFADAEQDPEAWMGVLDSYIDSPTGDEGYLQWMKQFVSIYRISRALPEYVECFLNVNRMPRSFGLDAILNPRTYPDYSGGGPEPPPVSRTLGIGASFVLRELVRFGLIAQPLAHRHCYVPAQRVRSLLVALGSTDMITASREDYSSTIHRFLVKYLDLERATFGLGFDLPLLALAEDDELQRRLLGRPLETDREIDAGYDEGWRTAPDGHRYNLYWH